ncbi:MAG TPA: NAD(P)-dependent glycerol-1-phosphate dehydrogenase, partial [Nitrososphaera sp.]|nr:NAD(P)-dependent glycerol-1-phosphate dehydrogenase [Nitrososphaera sp.]
SPPSHLMELPRKILIGDRVITEVGPFVRSLDTSARSVAVITGKVVKERAGMSCGSSLEDAMLKTKWHVVSDASMDTVNKLHDKIKDDKPDYVIGFGGGRSVDVAKMTAYKLSRPFLSVPTSASHDGISSPFVSVRGIDKPHSIKANTPIGVLADTHLLSQAPARLLAGGCGDLVAKITAVKDWELARDIKGEYFGTYAANLAYMSAQIILEESEKLKKNEKLGIRTVVEALISAGVAACIAGSSRPCSGAEHLFSHALEYIVGGNAECGLHGERVGIGTIMMAKLHGLDWENVRGALEDMGAPTKAKHIGLTEDDVVQALVKAQSLRPDRYTILSKVKMDRKKARELAAATKVI